MKEYIENVIVSYVKAARAKHNCPDSHVLLIADCWKVHIGEEFRTYMARKHPKFHMMYVPANMTSKCQPADLAL